MKKTTYTKKQYNELYADYEALKSRIQASFLLRNLYKLIWRKK